MDDALKSSANVAFGIDPGNTKMIAAEMIVIVNEDNVNIVAFVIITNKLSTSADASVSASQCAISLTDRYTRNSFLIYTIINIMIKPITHKNAIIPIMKPPSSCNLNNIPAVMRNIGNRIYIYANILVVDFVN